MLLPSHLRRSRHGVFYFRLVLPKIIAASIGQRELHRSLSTRNPKEAKLTGYQIWGAVKPLMERLARLMAIDPNSINPEDIKKLIIEGLEIRPDGNFRAAQIQTSDDPTVACQEMESLAALARSYRQEDWSPETAARLEAEARQLKAELSTMMRPMPPHPATLHEAYASYFFSKRGMAASTKKSYTESLDLFAARTCSDHLTNLLGFFDWAIKAGRYLEPNPFEGQVKHSDGENDGGAEPFTEDELKKIFASETFMQAKRPHEYWGPLFALLTGARADEIACLDLVDFITENEVRRIEIRHRPRKKPDSIEHKASKKRTKNKNARRIVPFHPKLFELGLDDYLADLKSIGATRFFPRHPMDSREQRDRYLSRDINSYLMKVGVHEPRTKVLHSCQDTVSDALGESNLDSVRADQWTGHAPSGVKARNYRSRTGAAKQARDGFTALNFPFLPFDQLR